ncbi:adenylate/guanylate cyclase domain-containing protein [Lysinibacillus capsici]|uniref:adenylate/guanylate cyclase domain-containing protein n=1 Tax=Lysinibacillus capsici TaxID=2115968 RepID=UPI003D07D9E3
MSLKDDINEKVKEIIDNNFTVEKVSYIPDIADTKLTFGNKGLKFEATVLNIDMRGSTSILNKHNRSTVAKIHMAYFHTIVKIASKLGGHVRSFNGDSMLVFFPGTTKTTLSNAVKTAMHLKYMLNDSSSGINTLLAKYSEIDFGIGLHDGEILCTKIGVGGESNNKGLFWAGNAVNKAVKLSDKAKSPDHILISEFVYNNLTDEVKFDEKEDNWGNKYNHDIWTKVTLDFEYNGTNENYYKTSYHWTFTDL